MTTLVAHQGGWDEILMLVGVALLVVGFLRWSERRARRRAEEEGSEETGESRGRD